MMKTLLDQYRRVHLVGIGGAGMEGLARLLAAKGCVVSGSDQADSPSVELLRQEGFIVAVGHDGQFVQGVDLVVYSAAVPADNPERQAAAHEGIPTASRAEVLGELSRAPLTLAVAGTHGKTTTASMAAAILRRAGLDPQVLIGGWINGRPQAEVGKWRGLCSGGRRVCWRLLAPVSELGPRDKYRCRTPRLLREFGGS